jgi:hypothetical protein
MKKMTTIEKNRTRTKTKTAIGIGVLVPAPCEKCGAVNAQVHHEDYENPLDVRWLCRKHHLEYHGIVRGLNGRVIDGLIDKWLAGETISEIVDNDPGPFCYTIELSPYFSKKLYHLMKAQEASASFILQSALDDMYRRVAAKP